MASREEQPAHDWAPKSRSAPSAAPGERACDAPRRSGCTEPSGAALSGGCKSSCASSYRRRRAGAPRPIGWRRRHSCFVEPRAFGRRSCRTRQCGQHCGSDRSRRRQWLCGFKLRRSAVKAGLKPLFGRCKRNTRTSLTATNRSFVAPISAPRGSIIGLLSAPRSL